MRSLPFLQRLAAAWKECGDQPFRKAQIIVSNNKVTHGGWEGWMQVEIALALAGTVARWFREEPYRNQFNQYLSYNRELGIAEVQEVGRSAARCDFYTEPHIGFDITYFELKCYNPNAIGNSTEDSWSRVLYDLKKAIALWKMDSTINIICTLVDYGNIRSSQEIYSAIEARQSQPPRDLVIHVLDYTTRINFSGNTGIASLYITDNNWYKSSNDWDILIKSWNKFNNDNQIKNRLLIYTFANINTDN
jgi:hypothetical protein